MAVPIQSPPPPSQAEQAVERMEAENKMLADERFTGWAVIWTLFGFKIGTVVIIVVLGSRNVESGTDKWWAYLISTTWYWFIIPLVSLSGLIIWRMRLRRARKNAQHLRRSEFSLLTATEVGTLTDEEKERLRQVRHLREDDRSHIKGVGENSHE